MLRVDIYAESDSISHIPIERRTIYVLEFIHPSTESAWTEAEGIREKRTYHQTIMRALVRALKRMNQNCEIHIHTQDTWLMTAMEKSMEEWAAAGFRTKAGKPLANQEEWQELYRLTNQDRQHLLVMDHGMHGYYDWTQDEMKRSRIKGTWETGVWMPLNSRDS